MNKQTDQEWKYISSIIAHPYEKNCGSLKSEGGNSQMELNPLVIFDESYLFFSSELSNNGVGGVHGFPWQYPDSVIACDPWALWPEAAPQYPTYNYPPTPDEGMRHRAAHMSDQVTTGKPSNQKIPNLYGYDGMEIVYQGFNNEEDPIKKTVEERWKKEISHELIDVTHDDIHLLYKNVLEWQNDGPPDKAIRDIWHPFGTGASNTLRRWMEPWNIFQGKNMTYTLQRIWCVPK